MDRDQVESLSRKWMSQEVDTAFERDDSHVNEGTRVTRAAFINDTNRKKRIESML